MRSGEQELLSPDEAIEKIRAAIDADSASAPIREPQAN